MCEFGEVGMTPAGYEEVEFADSFGTVCSLQQSSKADHAERGTSAIWIGVDNASTRMHLDREQVKTLHKVLKRWLRTGSFKLVNAKRKGLPRAKKKSQNRKPR